MAKSIITSEAAPAPPAIRRHGTAAAGPAFAICPLCGGPNACAPARSGRFAEACWCEGVAIERDVLARIPPALRDAACLCPACARGAAPQAGPG